MVPATWVKVFWKRKLANVGVTTLSAAHSASFRILKLVSLQVMVRLAVLLE